MKRPVPQLPAAVSPAPMAGMSEQVAQKTPAAIGADATDAALLAALDAPAFLHSARSRAHAAYQASGLSDPWLAPGLATLTIPDLADDGGGLPTS